MPRHPLPGFAALIGASLLAGMLAAAPAMAETGDSGEFALPDPEPTTTTELELQPVQDPERELAAGVAVAAEAATPEAATPETAAPEASDAEGAAIGENVSEDTLAKEPALESEFTAEAARVELNSDIAVIGLSWPETTAAPASVELRSLIDGAWTEWFPFELEEAAARIGATEPMSVTDAAAVEVVARYADPAQQGAFTLNVIDPRGGDPVENVLDPEGDSVREVTVQSAVAATASATADTGADFGLNIRPRAAWGPNEQLRKGYVAEGVRYQGAIVHHTAHGGPNTYSEAQVPGLIRSFYEYHVRLGWDDIGYQLLVDRFGNVWEGRHGSLVRALRGAQAYGANAETFGISVIGTYTAEAPSAAAQDATARAIAWMFDKYGILDAHGSIRVPGGDGTGRTIPTVAGHRDVGTGTACPGQAFYGRLPEMRDRVAAYLDKPLTEMVLRHEGGNRYETTRSAALADYPNGAQIVYLANGLDFPDSLAGGPAAARANAPLLLTQQASIPSATLKALDELRPKRAVVLGKTGAVGDAVVEALRARGIEVERIGGEDRYDTAARIALKAFPAAKTVYLASGENFPDALAGVPVAGADGAPLLLTASDELPVATKSALAKLKPNRIVVLGGTGSVSAAVATQAAAAASAKPKVERRDGANRYDTAAKTALSKYPEAETVYIASGTDFPDALAAGPAATRQRAPLLLVQPNAVPSQTQRALEQLRPKRIVVLGGQGAVTRENERRLDRYIVR